MGLLARGVSKKIIGRSSPQPSRRTVRSQPPQASTMQAGSQQPKGRKDTVSALNAAIEALNLAGKNSGVTPAKAVFATVSALLRTIRVRFLLPYDDLL